MQRLGRVLRILSKVVLIVLALVVAGLGAGFGVGRSHWGQQKFLGMVLPRIRQVLVGELRIGELTTDLTHMLVLRNVELTDEEGQVAISAQEIGLRYNLWALFVHKLDITAAHVKGGYVHARPLRKGPLNLVRLVRPSDNDQPAAPLPVTIQLNDVLIDAEAVADGVPPPLGPARAQVHAQAAVVLPRGTVGQVQVTLKALRITASEPLRAGLSAQGSLGVDSAGLLLKELKLQLDTDGEQVSRLVPGPQLRGPLALHAEVSGPPSKLALKVELTLPSGPAPLAPSPGTLPSRPAPLASAPGKLRAGPPAPALPPRTLTQGPLPQPAGRAPPPAALLPAALAPAGLTPPPALLPPGQALFTGWVGATTPGLPWQGALKLTNIDLQTLWAALPPVLVQLELDGSGEGRRGRLELRELQAAGLLTQLHASGFVAGDLGNPDPRAPQADLALEVATTDLGRLVQPLGVAAARGEAQLKARLQLHAGTAEMDLDARGKKLGLPPVQVQKLHLQFHASDLWTAQGQLGLDAEQLVVSGLRFERLHGQARGGPAALALELYGHGLDGVEFILDASGKPTFAGGKLQTLTATLKQLSLRRAADHLRLPQPAQLALSLVGPTAPVVTVQKLQVALDDQLLTIDGHYAAGSDKLSVQVAALRVDARRWAALLHSGLPIPATRLDAQVQLHGPLRAPQGVLELTGTTQPLAELKLPASTLALHAELSTHRLAGQATAMLGDKAPATGPKLALTFALPLPLSGPLALSVQASAQAAELTDYLPPPLHELRGALTLAASLKGTLARPELQLTLAAPSWQLGPLNGRDSTVQATYDGPGERLAIALGGRVQDAAGVALGALTVTAQVPLRTRLDAPLAPLLAQLRSAPLLIDGQLTQVHLPEVLRLVLPDSDPPLQAGLLNLGLKITGSTRAPVVALQAQATEIAAGPVHELDVGLTAQYAGSDLQLTLAAALAHQPLLQGHGSTQLTLAQVVAAPATFWRPLPLTAQVELQSFDLSRVSPLLHGTTSAQLLVKGTPIAPLLTAQLRAAQVKVATWQLGTINADASFDSNRQIHADLQVTQGSAADAPAPATDAPAPATDAPASATDAPAPGPKPQLGTLSLHGVGPLPGEPPSPKETPMLVLHAERFRVDYSPSDQPGADNATAPAGDLRRVRGTLDADARIELGAAAATLQGFIKLKDGELLHKALPQQFRDIALELQLQPGGHLQLVQLAAKAGIGSVQLHGTAKLDGQKLHEAQLELFAKNFPVAAGSIAGWLDTHVLVKAHTDANALRVDVQIPGGTLRLPKLSTSRTLQSIEPLSDVTFVDKAAQAEAARLRAEQEATVHARAARANPKHPQVPLLPAKLLINVQLPGSLAVAGPEVKTDLQGHLEVALTWGSPDGPVLTGQFSALGGSVEVLTRRYQVAHAAVSLSGETPPDPLLDVQISRQLDDATVSILVTGTARRPRISFRSDPAIYDQSQIIAILLSGQSGGNISSQAIGAISSLIVGQIKDQLGELLPIDVIKLDVSGNDPMGLGSSSLEIGKYLRDDLYLSYMHRFGGATTGLRRLNIDQVRLEYRFLSRFQLTTRYGDAQVGSLDLYWTKRF